MKPDNNIIPFEAKTNTGSEVAPEENTVRLDPPKELPIKAIDYWHELSQELLKKQSHGVQISELDKKQLCLVCTIWAEYVEAYNEMTIAGKYQTFQSGARQYSPEFTCWRDLGMLANKYMNQFGMTPSARMKMKAGDPNQGELFDDLSNY